MTSKHRLPCLPKERSSIAHHLQDSNMQLIEDSQRKLCGFTLVQDSSVWSLMIMEQYL